MLGHDGNYIRSWAVVATGKREELETSGQGIFSGIVVERRLDFGRLHSQECAPFLRLKS